MLGHARPTSERLSSTPGRRSPTGRPSDGASAQTTWITYSIHPAAGQDIANASDFYEIRAGIEVARRFLTEVDRAANLVDRNPEGGALLTKGRRVFHL